MRGGRPADPRPQRTEPVEFDGTLEVVHEDRWDGGSYRHVLVSDGGERLSVHGVPDGRDLVTGDRVRVRGHRVRDAIVVAPSTAPANGGATLRVLAAAPLSNTLGVQKVVVILVNFTNDLSQPYTVEAARSVFADVSAFWLDNSYQQTSLAADVYGWYTIPMTNATCDTAKIQTLAQQAASLRGVALSGYDRQVYAFPTNPTCPFAGKGTIGGHPSSAWFSGELFASHVAHELGHNLGLYHSHSLWCSGALLASTCSRVEYGDAFDPMGQGTGHYNAFQKGRIGWLNYDVSPPITAVQESGTYAIEATESLGAGPKALRIPRGSTGQSFYVEHRSQIGWQGNLASTTGVLVHLATDSDPDSSEQLDLSPATTSFADGVLAPGTTFADPVSGVAITALSVTGTSATVAVTAGALCVRANPSLAVTPAQSAAVPAGTTVSYTVAVTNTDSPGCAGSNFALQAPVPAGWQATYGSPALFLNPGGTVTTTLQITSPALAVGLYTLWPTVTNSAAPAFAGSASLVYDAVAVSVATAGVFTDDFDRPDSASLGNGWVAVSGSLKVQSGTAMNQVNTIQNVAIQPGVAGAAQTVAASFASTNNNTSPRFGVVLRYRDAKNYYTCYRQVGGSSVLAIAKVQNGVPILLKYAAVANPAPNVFSTLSCQANGTTLTLRLDGVVKVSATDASFTTGSVGYAMSSRLAASHRADNFNASAQ